MKIFDAGKSALGVAEYDSFMHESSMIINAFYHMHLHTKKKLNIFNIMVS